MRKILQRENIGVGYIPFGKKGIIFPAVEGIKHSEIMQKCLDAAFEAGVLPRADTPKETKIRQVGLGEIANEAMAGDMQTAEQGLAGHKGRKVTIAKEILGRKPSRLRDAWHKDSADSLKLLTEGWKGWTMESCIGVAGPPAAWFLYMCRLAVDNS